MAHDNQNRVSVQVIPLNTKEGTMLPDCGARYVRADSKPLSKDDPVTMLGVIDIALADQGYTRVTFLEDAKKIELQTPQPKAKV